MHILRKIFLALGTPLLGALIVGTLTLLSLNMALGQPGKLKQWLRDSKLYDNAVAGIIDQAKQKSDKQTAQTPQEGELPLDRPEFQAALRQAVTPAFLQQSAENIIDGTYSWLQKKTDKPTYNIDLTGVKTTLATSVGDQARARLATLPPCTVANQPTSADPFTINCRPPVNVSEPQIQKLITDITTNKDFLPANTVTADTTKLGEDSTASANAKPSAPAAQPWHQQAEQLPAIYEWAMRGPLILGVLAILTALGLVFAAHNKRAGLKIVAITSLSTGTLMAIGVGIMLSAFASATQQAGAKQTTQLQQPLVRLLTSASNALNYPLLWWGIGLSVAGTLGLIALYSTRPKLAHESVPATPPAVPEVPTPTDPADKS